MNKRGVLSVFEILVIIIVFVTLLLAVLGWTTNNQVSMSGSVSVNGNCWGNMCYNECRSDLYCSRPQWKVWAGQPGKCLPKSVSTAAQRC